MLRQRIASKFPQAGILLTPAERSMLKYVRNTCVIWRISLEPNREDIVLVVSGDVEIFCSSFLMFELKRCELQFRYMLLALERKPMQMFSKLWRLLESGH